METEDYQRSDTDTGKEPDAIPVRPVGVVRNQLKETNWGKEVVGKSWQEKAAEMQKQSETVSKIVINAELEGILDGIEDFSHLVVLYWSHLAPEKRRHVTRAHPLGSEKFPLVGVFATRSPVRPNGILCTTVRLLGKQGNTLLVTGLDALDGSPVLDIKPYLPENIDQSAVRLPEWMQKMRTAFQ